MEGQGFGFLLGEWIRVRPYKRRFGETGWEAVEVEGMGTWMSRWKLVNGFVNGALYFLGD